MANLSTLTVALTADTAKFENGLKKSRKQANQWGAAVKKGMTVAASGIAAATAGLTFLTKQSLDLVDRQTKLARVLGTSQAAFSGLALAAEISGSNMEAISKALRKQAKVVNDANDGLLTYVEVFDDLNLKASELIELPLEQQFVQIVDALGKLENQTKRTALASEIFGGKNADLLNFLELGAGGIQQYIDKVQEMGVALNVNQTGAIEASNDAVTIFKQSLSGLGNQLAAQFAPAIGRAAEALTNFVIGITQNVERIAQAVRRIFNLQADLNSLSLEGLRREYATTQDELTGVLQTIETQRERLDSLSGRNRAGAQASLNNALREEIALRAKLDQIIEKQKALINQTNPSFGEEGGGGGPAATPEPGRRDYKKEKWYIDLQENLAMFDEWEARAEQSIRATATPLEAFQMKLAEIRETLNTNPLFTADMAERETAAAVEVYLAELKRIEGGAEKTFSQIEEFQRAAFENTQQILADFLVEPFKDGLKGMLRSFVDMLRKMVAQLLAQKILTTFFGGFGGGGEVATTTGNAIGGTVDTRPRMVGERGPELFQPGARGSIRPIGAVNFESNTTIQSGGGLTVATLIPILEENNKKVKAEVLDAFDRGAYA